MGRSLKFLVVPNLPTASDRRMVNGLADGLRAISQIAEALAAPIDAQTLAQRCRDDFIDVVIEINRSRDRCFPLPPNTRHIAWYQDVFPSTLDRFAEGFDPQDILYALGDARILGLNVPIPCPCLSLCPGVSPTLLDNGVKRESIDFSLCAYVPPPRAMPSSTAHRLLVGIDAILQTVPVLNHSESCWLLLRQAFKSDLPSLFVPYRVVAELARIVEQRYQPLAGNLDIHDLVDAMHRYLQTSEEGAALPAQALKIPNDGSLPLLLRICMLTGSEQLQALVSQYGRERLATNQIDRAINHFAREYPRLLDRVELVRNALRVSTSLELYGKGWNRHKDLSRFAKGAIENQDSLIELYRRTRINLANNTHGLGLHSRNLECMAVGGFILTHESPHDTAPGGIRTAFEADTHYGVYKRDNFDDVAKRWLRDERKRLQVGSQAAMLVRSNHGWHHRAQQILDDLGR